MSTDLNAATFDDLMTSDLMGQDAPGSISIIMPTMQGGREVKQNSIRYKNLLDEVFDRLSKAGEPEGDIRRRLAPLFDRLTDERFWQKQHHGVAIYFRDGAETVVPLHHEPHPQAHMGESFFVKPVVIDQLNAHRAIVLALAWEHANLYLCNDERLSEIKNDSFPVAIRDVVLPPDTEPSLQFNGRRGTTTQGPGNFHGQGAGADTQESDRGHFMRSVNDRLIDVRKGIDAPLAIVCTDEVLGHFAKHSHHETSLHMSASPDGFRTGGDLQRRVVEMVNKEQHSGHERLHERFGTARSQGKASADVADVIRAADQGRVEVLFVHPDKSVWGTAYGDDIEVHAVGARPQGIDTTELSNLAVLKTLRTGGRVVPCDSDRIIEDQAVAAIFRF